MDCRSMNLRTQDAGLGKHGRRGEGKVRRLRPDSVCTNYDARTR